MIQVSDFIAMFAPSSPKDIILIFKRRAFLCPIGSIVSKDIRLSIPIREYPFFIDCILVLAGTGRRQPSLYLNISNTFSLMARTDVICNAVNNSTRRPPKRASASLSFLWTATPYVTTPHLANAVASHPIQQLCASHSAMRCFLNIPASVESKSRIAASVSMPEYGCIPVVSYTTRHIRCETLPEYFVKRLKTKKSLFHKLKTENENLLMHYVYKRR